VVMALLDAVTGGRLVLFNALSTTLPFRLYLPARGRRAARTPGVRGAAPLVRT
jgi:hypothetical protein